MLGLDHPPHRASKCDSRPITSEFLEPVKNQNRPYPINSDAEF